MTDVQLKANIDSLVVFNPNDKVKIIDALCSLANGKDSNGYLFGIMVLDDNNEEVLSNTRLASRFSETIMEIVNELGKMIFPEYLPTMSLVDKNDKAIVLVECLPGEKAPYIYPENLEYQNFIEGTTDLEKYKIKDSAVIPQHIQSFTFDMDDEDEEEIDEPTPVTVEVKPQPKPEVKPVIEKPQEKVVIKEVVKEVVKEPEEKVETRCIHFISKMNKDYIYQKDFIGTVTQQLNAFQIHLVNNFLESKLYPDTEQPEYNYAPELVAMMCKEAYNVAYGDLEITISKDDFRIVFDCDENLEFNDLDWEVEFEEKTAFILPINNGYIHHPQEGMATNNRRSNAEIRSLVLEVLTEPMSTNELAKKMGYKGISKTLSQIVKELVNEEKIEYMNPDNPRSSNQKLRRKF